MNLEDYLSISSFSSYMTWLDCSGVFQMFFKVFMPINDTLRFIFQISMKVLSPQIELVSVDLGIQNEANWPLNWLTLFLLTLILLAILLRAVLQLKVDLQFPIKFSSFREFKM